MTQELTRAELEIMKILWDMDGGFVNDVVDRMPDPKPAYNTVSTIIRILERKGVVAHQGFGRSHRYHPLIGREQYTEQFMRGVMNNFFDNSFSQMFSFFSSKEHLKQAEIDEILKIANRIVENQPSKTVK